MAVTNQELFNIFLANPNMSDAQIVSLMEQRGISPAQVSQTFGIPEGQVSARVAATVPNGQTVTLGDTIVQPVYQVSGSGMDQQIGGLENVITYKASDNKAGGAYTQYTPTGEVEQTGTQQEVKSGLKEFALGAAVLFGLPTLLNAGAAGAATAAGAEAATAFELANAGIVGGAATFTPAQLALIEAGASAAEVAAAGTSGGLLTGGADVTTNTARELAAANVATPTTPIPTALTPATVTPVASAVTPTGLLSSVVPTSVADAVTKVGTGVATNLLTKSGADAVSGLLQTTGSLVQSQESKDAAQKAATDITKATQTGVEASQFRPVGMTTRFGTSNYTYDPVTGRMTSAGYQLSPEAKNAQDRLVALTGRGLTQAEQAQSQFAPLQTAAQNLYSLGSQYIAKSPEEAAQDYINKQMQLLQPSRELDLANLQNRLFQQGRTGVSVAQGGTLGATTPELQALYNARAMQDLQLASQATQAGQANTLFGSNLYDLGTAKLSNYYGGQAQAYQPFTTALGQVQNLETQAQQPLAMGANLAQQASAAGYRAGSLGVQGAQAAGALSTGKAATTNPYAYLFSGVDPAFGQGLAKQIFGV